MQEWILEEVGICMRRKNKVIRHLKKNYTLEIILSLVIVSSFTTGVFYSQVNYEKKIGAQYDGYKPPHDNKIPPDMTRERPQPQTVNTEITHVHSGDNHNVKWNANITNKNLTFYFSGYVINQSVSISKYECNFDLIRWVPCDSPVSMYDGHVMDPGTHSFEVRAFDNYSHADPSPASFVWSVPK